MPRALIFYHYFFPDDVVSATHISELAQGLVKRGWDVTAMPATGAVATKATNIPTTINGWECGFVVSGVRAFRKRHPLDDCLTPFG